MEADTVIGLEFAQVMIHCPICGKDSEKPITCGRCTSDLCPFCGSVRGILKTGNEFLARSLTVRIVGVCADLEDGIKGDGPRLTKTEMANVIENVAIVIRELDKEGKLATPEK